MNQCLSEETLYELRYGESQPTTRAHLESCDSCARRMKSLESDLKLVSSVLTHTPPPHVAPAFRPRIAYPAFAMAAAAALALTFTAGRWSGRTQVRDAAIVASVDEQIAEETASVLVHNDDNDDTASAADFDPFNVANLMAGTDVDEVDLSADADS
jgi:hypothetical protein